LTIRPPAFVTREVLEFVAGKLEIREKRC
jgi:hypothetical protein